MKTLKNVLKKIKLFVLAILRGLINVTDGVKETGKQIANKASELVDKMDEKKKEEELTKLYLINKGLDMTISFGRNIIKGISSVSKDIKFVLKSKKAVLAISIGVGTGLITGSLVYVLYEPKNNKSYE